MYVYLKNNIVPSFCSMQVCSISHLWLKVRVCGLISRSRLSCLRVSFICWWRFPAPEYTQNIHFCRTPWILRLGLKWSKVDCATIHYDVRSRCGIGNPRQGRVVSPWLAHPLASFRSNDSAYRATPHDLKRAPSSFRVRASCTVRPVQLVAVAHKLSPFHS